MPAVRLGEYVGDTPSDAQQDRAVVLLDIPGGGSAGGGSAVSARTPVLVSAGQGEVGGRARGRALLGLANAAEQQQAVRREVPSIDEPLPARPVVEAPLEGHGDSMI